MIWLEIRRIPGSRFNTVTTWIVFGMMSLYAYFTPESTEVLAGRVRELCDFGLNFAGALLGFLIAGFTIFATLSKPGLFLAMAKITKENSKLSYLKSNFFNFMKTFILFFLFVCVCLLVKLFASPSGAVSLLISHLDIDVGVQKETKHFLSEVGIVFVSTSFIYVVVLLQSFIFNVYHAIMTSLRWEAENPT